MDAAMVGEAFLGAVVGVLVDRLASLEFIDFFRGGKHDESRKKLEETMVELNKVLNDAENKQFTDQSVKRWLEEVKDAVYHVEDLVDEIATEDLRSKVEADFPRGKKRFRDNSLISTFTRFFDRGGAKYSKLGEMIVELDQFVRKAKDVLGLREVAGRYWSQTRLPSTSVVDESCVYGRENDKNEIMKLLEDDKPCGTFENVRHFSCVQRNFDGVDKLRLIKDAKCLRTFLQINHRIDRYGSLRKMLWLSNKVLDEIILGMPRLRLLSLSQYEFEELPCSIGKLIHLRFLDLSNSRITQLPESVCTLYNLETLLLSLCHFLTTLPADLGKLISLRRLDLSDHSFGTNLKEMPVSISRLKDLQQLTDFVVGKCSGSGINGLKELNSLRGAITISGLENVTSGDNALEAKLKEKKHLQWLTLEWGSTTEDSQKERDVLENLEPHTNLKILEITNFGGTRFPNWLGDKSFCNMVRLWLHKYENCFSLPPLGQMSSLESLRINYCPKIETFPEGGLPSGLTSLRIWKCEKLKSLPEQLHTLLPSLQSLVLLDCPEIESFSEGSLPSKLVDLTIRNCEKLVGGRRDWGLRTLPSLTNFYLGGESEDVLESFPEEGLLPPIITELWIVDLRNLKSLNGRALQPLVSLKRMLITNCPQLQSLPVERLPTSLSELIIRGCPLLEPRCRREEGEDWHKIDHIRFISIDDKVISETISYSH
ncbi:hypothetical protein RHSIM_Rhsim07G0059600 [Rhododendron simsii]|uniref:Rx N-terminal domain-containing protein n=1 Tax=Rhododendron simsii TaxID=118357 RepID=A0A834GLV7_RHOSS|nr:hypothetical protein RHSIM_Rhsim07G0059600 [Rhododendron simsii]